MVSGPALTLPDVPGLILPSSVAPAKAPKSKCYLCGLEVDAEHPRKFLRHVRSCARDNVEGVVLEQIARDERTFFTSSPDPERDAHLARGGN